MEKTTETAKTESAKENHSGTAVDQISNPKFDLTYKTIEDKRALCELLDCVRLSNPKHDSDKVQLADAKESALTPLGVEVLELLVEKATIVPCVCIAHNYSYKSEHREYFIKKSNFQGWPYKSIPKFANFKRVGQEEPSFEDNRFFKDFRKQLLGDLWNDERFLKDLKDETEYEKKEDHETTDNRPHYWEPCGKCKGTGKGEAEEYRYEDVKYWDDCPRCHGTGKTGIYICDRCDGKGRVIAHTKNKKHVGKVNCEDCDGHGGICYCVIPKQEKTESKGWRHSIIVDPGLASFAGMKGVNEIAVEDQIVEAPPFSIPKNFKGMGDAFPWLKENKLLKLIIGEKDVSAEKVKQSIETSVLAGKVHERIIEACGKPQNDENTRYEYYGEEAVNIYIGICGVKFTIKKESGGTNDLWWDVVRNRLHGLKYESELLGRGEPVSTADRNLEVQEAIKTALAKGVRKMPDKKRAQTKKRNDGNPSNKKRWKFVLLGLLFGWFGAHYMYAKRWLMLLLTLGSFATGVVMMNKSESNQKEVPVQTEQQTEGDASKGNSEAIGAVCLVLWLVMWLGGALFVKKDGKGNRM